MLTSSRRAYSKRFVTQVAAPRALPLWQATADPCLCGRLKHRSGSVSVGSLGPGGSRFCLSSPSALWWVWGLVLSVISPSYCPVGASPFPWMWNIFFRGIQHSLSMVVQQGVVVLEFSQREDELTAFCCTILPVVFWHPHVLSQS